MTSIRGKKHKRFFLLLLLLFEVTFTEFNELLVA